MLHYGDGAKGLGSKQAIDKFGYESVKSGISGERFFHDQLKKNKLLKSYMTWSSVRMPRPKRANGSYGKQYSGDVDFVIANGNQVVLVDVKRWYGGQIYWSGFGKMFKGLEVMNKGKPISKNMSLALEAFSSNLPGMKVSAMVVFVPHKNGLPASVSFLRWPGGVRSYIVGNAIAKINRQLGEPKPVHQDIQALLGRHVK